MSTVPRAVKRRKLTNLIKAYRGSYNSDTKVWSRQPQPQKRKLVEESLADFGVTDVPAAMVKIDGFKKVEDFYKWINAL